MAGQTASEEARVLTDEELPGVGDAEMSLRQGVEAGGLALLVLLAALNAVDQLYGGAVGILAPDIRKSLHMSNTLIAVATVGGTLFLILGGLVLGRLADNGRRTTIVGIATAAWGGLVLLTALVTNALVVLRGDRADGTRAIEHPGGAGPDAGRRVPDPGVGRVFAAHGIAGSVGATDRAAGGRRNGVADRRRERVAVGVRGHRHPDDRGRHRHVLHAGSAAWPVRAEGNDR